LIFHRTKVSRLGSKGGVQVDRIEMRKYKKWLAQVLQKEDLTAQDMEQILDGQLRLPARSMDGALIRRCRLALYPHIQGADVPGKQETLNRVHAFLQKEGNKEDKKKNESASARSRFFLRPATLVASVLFCVILFNVSYDAVGFNIWNLLFSWDDETMEINFDVQAKFTKNVDYLNQTQTDAFFHKLEELEITPLLPSWMPEGFELKSMDSKVVNEYNRWAAGDYSCGDRDLLIFVFKSTSMNTGGNLSLEKDEREPDIFEQGGIKFYIMDNLSRSLAFWYDPPYKVQITGQVTREELRQMIDSMFERSTSK
jgi:hypothetical protein